jgi:GT2 family glycosyltransferase
MDKKTPLFSVIVPTYRRPDQLKGCLRSLAGINYPKDYFEVVVVDDEGGIPLETFVSLFQDKLDITFLVQSHAGPAKARNTGAGYAKGQFLVFTDDDCRPTSDWLENLEERFSEAPDAAIAGRAINTLSDNVYSTASQILIDYLHAYYNVNPNRGNFLTSNNLGVPSAQFLITGGFDTDFPRAAGEDREFCDRWLYHGYRIIYTPKVLVYHAHPLTLRTYWRQHFNYGRGAFTFHKIRAQRNSEQFKLEPLSFYVKLVRYPLSLSVGLRVAALVALLMVSQVANGVGFFWERLSQRWRKGR